MVTPATQSPGCPFCPPESRRIILETALVLGIWDDFPAAPGHALLIPRRHVVDWFGATGEEWAALAAAIAPVRALIEERATRENRPRPDGYNVGFNAGVAAGQTVFHLHLHVIPRFLDDAESRGGIRAAIPGKLGEFVVAQDKVYDRVLRELAAGRKESHWMWFIFPQMAGLGFSPMARKFGITSEAEARSYLQHGVLGPRLRECTALLLACPDPDIHAILGSPDDLKFRSSMTLFAAVAPGEPLFRAALERFYGGEGDAATIGLLERSRPHGAPAPHRFSRTL